MSTKQSLKELARKKIDSPLAKYNSVGQLFCVLCNSQVKNEMYWTGHVNGKGHRENLAVLKAKQNNGSSAPPPVPNPFKRPAPVDGGGGGAHPPLIPTKTAKLDRSGASPVEDEGSSSGSSSAVAKAEEELRSMMMMGQGPLGTSTRSNDGGEDDGGGGSSESPDEVVVPVGKASAVPEGFFDDPKEDAKARGVKFKDPQDLEWDKFVKEIATEDVKSSEMVVVDQEKSAVERELEHIEEQMVHWQRVIDLEKRAQEWKSGGTGSNSMDVDKEEDDVKGKNKKQQAPDADEEDDDDELEYDEELDWRNKKR